MRIAMDLREACRPDRTGKGQWTFGFVHELQRRNITIIGYTDQPSPLFLSHEFLRLHVCDGRGLGWHRQVASHVKKAKEADVYVSPTSFIVPVLLGKRFPTVPIVHDLIAFQHGPHDVRAKAIERLTLKRALRSAKHVFTVSHATKRDLRQRFPFVLDQDVTVIYCGPMASDPQPCIPDERTILCIATLAPRKNQRRLIEAFARLPHALRSRFQLKLYGARGWNDDEILSLAKNTPGVSWEGYAKNEEYEKLLHTCTVFALPSLYEGFGMQLLDALQRGIPVLTSDRGSIREVCGDAAVYADPEDVGSICEGLQVLLTSNPLRETLREKALKQAKNFSWEKTADLFLDTLERVVP